MKRRRGLDQLIVLTLVGLVAWRFVFFHPFGWDEPSPLREEVEQAVVIGVIDGDTLEVSVGGERERERIRLIGIDAPERGELGADEAVDFIHAQLRPLRYLVWLTGSGPNRDGFGRLRRYVWLQYEAIPEGQSLNELLLEAGHAVIWGERPNRSCHQ